MCFYLNDDVDGIIMDLIVASLQADHRCKGFFLGGFNSDVCALMLILLGAAVLLSYCVHCTLHSRSRFIWTKLIIEPRNSDPENKTNS